MNSSLRSGLLIALFSFCISSKAQVIVAASESNDNTVVNDTSFVNLKEFSGDFVYDMKYATEDNFLKAKVYECAECYLRLKTVNALIEANNEFVKRGYRIKLFDCYRPLDIQKKCGKLFRNPNMLPTRQKGPSIIEEGLWILLWLTMQGKNSTWVLPLIILA